MRPDTRAIHLTIKPIHWVLFFSLLQLLVALLTHSLAFTQEESMWHYIGRNWFRHGLIPYSGGVDNKSPLIFSIFGLSDWLFGVNYWFPRVLGTIAQSIGIIYLFKITVYLDGKQAGLLAIIFYGCSLTWRSTGGKYVSFTETYAMLFIIMAFYYALTATKQRSYFISGLLAGIGFIARISAAFGIVALLVTLLRKNRQASLLFLFGVLVSITLLIGLFFIAGINPSDLIRYGFSGNFGPGSITDHSWSWKLDAFADLFFYSELTLFYPFIIAYFFTGNRKAVLTTWLVFEFIGIVALGVFARNHLKHILPVFSIMSAISLAWLVDKYKVPYRPILFIILIAFFPKSWEPVFGLKNWLVRANSNPALFCQPPYPQPDEQGKKQLGLWIKANTKDADLVYIAGTGSTIQAYSERISPTMYFNATQTSKAKEKLYADLHLNSPAWILVPRFSEYKMHVYKDTRDFVDSLVSKNYRPVQCMYGYLIFRQK